MIASGETRLEPKDGETLHVIVEDSAEIVEQGTGTYAIRVTLGPGASATYKTLNENTHATRQAVLADDASLRWIDVLTGGGTSIVTTRLEGTGANAEYHSVFLGRADEEYVIKSDMHHAGSRSTSNMRTRGVMLEKAKGEYEGLIRIDPDAAGCDAYQKEDTILLSPGARMRATPNLEIRNEDVRCSHGVSLSRVDDEKIFYLQSRGIARHEAIRLIVHGFFDEVLSMMGAHSNLARKRIFSTLEVPGA